MATAKKTTAPKTFKAGDKVKVLRRDGTWSPGTFVKYEAIKTGQLLHVTLKDGTLLKPRPAQVK